MSQVRADLGWEMEEVGCEWTALCLVGDLSSQGVAGGSEPAVCVAVEWLVWQVMQRSNDGGKMWETAVYDGVAMIGAATRLMTWLQSDSADQKKPPIIRPAFREVVVLIGNVAWFIVASSKPAEKYAGIAPR
jgi:hypothetical protein